MKKGIKLFLAGLMVLSVAGCNKNKETEDEKIEKSFATYLDNRSAYSASDLDDYLGPVSLPTGNMLSEVNITNSKLQIQVDENTIDGYMWKKVENNEDYLYGVAIADEATDSYLSGKVSLTRISDAIEDTQESAVGAFSSFMFDTNGSTKLEYSELIDNILASNGINTNEISVDKILKKLNYKSTDFEHQGNGVFKLKTSSIVRTLNDFKADISEEEAADFEKYFKVLVTYKDNHITEINLNINVTDNTANLSNEIIQDSGLIETMFNPMAMNIKIAFTYSNNAISKTQLTLVANESYDGQTNYTEYSIVYGANEFIVQQRTGKSVMQINSDLRYSVKTVNGKTTIEYYFKEKFETANLSNVEVELSPVGDSAIENIEFNLTIGIVDNWLADASFKFSAGEEQQNINIVNSVNVTIPQNIRELGDDAYDFTDDIFANLEY